MTNKRSNEVDDILRYIRYELRRELGSVILSPTMARNLLNYVEWLEQSVQLVPMPTQEYTVFTCPRCHVETKELDGRGDPWGHLLCATCCETVCKEFYGKQNKSKA